MLRILIISNKSSSKMTAFVFPGQGSQFIGMSKDFYDNFIVAREVFELISDTTKINIKRYYF